MSRMRLELAVVVAVIGVSAAFFAAQPDNEDAPSPSPSRVTLTVTPSPIAASGTSTVARVGSQHPRFGKVPCTVELQGGDLNLIFKNDTAQDYELYQGGGMGHYRLTKVSRQGLEIAAEYRGCSMTYEHDCFHFGIFSVPAGQARTMKLGPAPKELKGYPAQLPGFYITTNPDNLTFPGRPHRD